MHVLRKDQIAWKWWLATVFVFFIGLFCIYSPGLSGDYEFDDRANILDNSSLKISDLSLKNLYRASNASGFSGPLKRPISMATFSLNIYFTGFDPYYMKLTNVFIHSLNGLSILILTLVILSAYRLAYNVNLTDKHIRWIALATALSWSFHPLALTSTLYIVQRMTSLSALFTIWGLIGYAWSRLLILSGKRGMPILIISLMLFGILGILSKENGALIILFAFTIEFSLLRFKTITLSQKRSLYIIYIFALAVPVISICTWLIANPEWLTNNYSTRTFNLSERLLTESRVIWFYIYLIILPNISVMGIYHDDISISENILTPITTLPSILLLTIVVVCAIFYRKRFAPFSFGILFFFAGHILESTVLPLEIAHEHRNYLPMYGIILIVMYYLIAPIQTLLATQKRIIFSTSLILLLAASTTVRASYWGNLLEHSMMEVRNHPQSARTQFQTARMYWKLALSTPENKTLLLQRAREHFMKTYLLSNPKNEALFALIHISFFSDTKLEPHWLTELIYSLKNYPLPSSTISVYHSYILCQIGDTCKLSREKIREIYEAMLDNSTLEGRNRASVFSISALYEANQQEYTRALELLRSATNYSSGDLSFRLTLIDLLIKLHQFDEAKDQISIIKGEDKFATYTRKILEKENMLNKYINDSEQVNYPSHQLNTLSTIKE